MVHRGILGRRGCPVCAGFEGGSPGTGSGAAGSASTAKPGAIVRPLAGVSMVMVFAPPPPLS